MSKLSLIEKKKIIDQDDVTKFTNQILPKLALDELTNKSKYFDETKHNETSYLNYIIKKGANKILKLIFDTERFSKNKKQFINSIFFENATPLLTAISSRNYQAMDLLLENGASTDKAISETKINAATRTSETVELTPILLAISNNDDDAIKMLMKYNVKISPREINMMFTRKLVNSIERLPSIPKAVVENYILFITQAIEKKDFPFALFVLKKASEQTPFPIGQTNLTNLLKLSFENKAPPELIQTLKQFGAKPSRNIFKLAIENKDINELKELLDMGINPNFEKENKKAPLTLAINEKFYDGIDMLLKYKADPYSDPVFRANDLALMNEDSKILESLIKYGNIKITDEIITFFLRSRNVAMIQSFDLSKYPMNKLVSFINQMSIPAMDGDKELFTILLAEFSKRATPSEYTEIWPAIERMVKNKNIEGLKLIKFSGFSSEPLYTILNNTIRVKNNNEVLSVLLSKNILNYLNINYFKEFFRNLLSYGYSSDIEIMKSILKNLNVNNYKTILSDVLSYDKLKNMELIEFILEVLKVDPNYTEPATPSAIHIAINTNNLEALKLLVSKGAKIGKKTGTNKTNYDSFIQSVYTHQYPLMRAIEINNLEIAKFLIEQGADINIKHRITGHNLLELAIHTKNLELVKLLVENGFDVNTISVTHNGSQLSVLDYALIKNIPVEIISYLIDKGAKSTISLLSQAIKNQQLELVTLLVEKGEDINAKSSMVANAESPFQIAFRTFYTLSRNNQDTTTIVDIINFLIHNGGDLNEQLAGDPLFIRAAQWQMPTVVKSFIDVGVNVNIVGKDNYTALATAVEKKNLDIVKMLLEDNADPRILPTTLAKNNTILDLATNINIKNYLKEYFRVGLKWGGATKDDFEVLWSIFDSEDPNTLENFSYCPVCLALLPRGMEYVYEIIIDPTTGKSTKKVKIDPVTKQAIVVADPTYPGKGKSLGCRYMHHDCKGLGRFYDEDLFNKYKGSGNNPEIVWCVVCNRICYGHKHFKLMKANKENPSTADLLQSGTPFGWETECLADGGGGVAEKILRLNAMVEKISELQSQVNIISDREARTQIIRAAWDAPLNPPAKAAANILSSKKFSKNKNILTAISATQNNDKIEYPTLYRPAANRKLGLGIVHKGPGMNAVSFNDDETFSFNHRRQNGEIINHTEVIGLQSLIDWFNSTSTTGDSKFGKCPLQLPNGNPCDAFVYPEDIDTLLKFIKEHPDVLTKYPDAVAGYQNKYDTIEKIETIFDFYKKVFNKTFRKKYLPNAPVVVAAANQQQGAVVVAAQNQQQGAVVAPANQQQGGAIPTSFKKGSLFGLATNGKSYCETAGNNLEGGKRRGTKLRITRRHRNKKSSRKSRRVHHRK